MSPVHPNNRGLKSTALAAAILLLPIVPTHRLLAQCFDWQERPMPYRPSNASGFAMAYDSKRGLTLLYKAGVIVQEYPLPAIPVSELWQYGGRGWAKCIVSESLMQSQRPEPRARYYSAIAFDAARGETVLFGGQLNAPPYGISNETWTWDGSSWAQRFVTGPSARTGHLMAYDSHRSVVVLFGGGGSEPPAHPTWEWDGATWMPRAAASVPPLDTNCMAYDTGRGVTVLLTRNRVSGLYVSETWEWDGGDWVRRQPVHSPQAQGGAAMAYDSDRHVCVLFGGAAPNGPALQETWEWDGVDWVQRATAIQPTSRVGHRMVYDSIRGKIVLFGGDNAEPFGLNDTWEYPLTPPSPSVQIVTQPVSVTACVGASVYFQVVAAGDPPLTYQWRRNGVNYGYRNARLDISPVRATSAGTYDVVVSNRCNSVVSNPVTLTLCSGPNPDPSE